MTDNTKMREAFERWAEGYDIRLVRDGVFADDYADGDAEIAWRAWQAAQAVPGIGEPVAWVNEYCIDEWERSQKDNWSGARLTAKEVPGSTVPLFRKPTHSITEAELERLRKCELLLREARDDVADQLNYMIAALAGYPTNDMQIQKQRDFLAAIDAAIALIEKEVLE